MDVSVDGQRTEVSFGYLYFAHEPVTLVTSVGRLNFARASIKSFSVHYSMQKTLD